MMGAGLRSPLKILYQTPEEALEKVMEFIREALDENGVSFEMIV